MQVCACLGARMQGVCACVIAIMVCVCLGSVCHRHHGVRMPGVRCACVCVHAITLWRCAHVCRRVCLMVRKFMYAYECGPASSWLAALD